MVAELITQKVKDLSILVATLNFSRDFSNSVILVNELISKPLHRSIPVSPYLDSKHGICLIKCLPYLDVV